MADEVDAKREEPTRDAPQRHQESASSQNPVNEDRGRPCYGSGHVHPPSNAAQSDIGTSLGKLSNKDLVKVKDEIGSEWQQLGLMLEYQHKQLEKLDIVYPQSQLSTKILQMLLKWRDVVEEHGEDSRLMLAAAFMEMRNREAAENITNAIEDAQKYKPCDKTVQAIKTIRFDVKGDTVEFERSSSFPQQSFIGGQASLNVFGGGRVEIAGTVQIRTGEHSFQHDSKASTVPAGLDHFGRMNIGGEQSMNVFDGNICVKEGGEVYIGSERESYQKSMGAQKQRPQTLPDQRRSFGATDFRAEGVDVPDATTAVYNHRQSGSHQYKKQFDDTFSESVAAKFVILMASVGYIVSPNGIGTVFRVGSKYVMTAWHVVKMIVADPQAYGQVNCMRLEAEDVRVSFREDPKLVFFVSDFYRVKGNIVFYDEEIDIAVLELNPEPGQTLPQPLTLSAKDVHQSGVTDVTLIGYGHPNSDKKHMDPRCPVVPKYSDRIQAAHAWVEQHRSVYKDALEKQQKDLDKLNDPYHGLQGSEFTVTFSCYMEQGGSGSPGIAIREGGTLEVVAILTKGYPVFFWDLPDSEQLVFPKEYRFEAGTSVKEVYVRMRHSGLNALIQDLFQTNS